MDYRHFRTPQSIAHNFPPYGYFPIDDWFRLVSAAFRIREYIELKWYLQASFQRALGVLR